MPEAELMKKMLAFRCSTEQILEIDVSLSVAMLGAMNFKFGDEKVDFSKLEKKEIQTSSRRGPMKLSLLQQAPL